MERAGKTTSTSHTAMTAAANRSRVRKSTLVFDGHCPFCRRWISRIARWDRDDVLEMVARQTDGLTDRFPRLADGDFNTGMRLITPDHVIHVGADAAYQVARRLRYGRWIAWAYHVPIIHWLTRSAYAWVAAHRSDDGGFGGDCTDSTCKPG